MDHRTENWLIAVRNNAIAHIKQRKYKSYEPTEKEIEDEVSKIIPKVRKL